ncbi:unnamed protein product [Ostreobium quekettii]|uniref:Cytochrome P450 n=1 Tax=Ostreobium quekettii TaxID=121088 RepID=A0A8S1ILF5_9CHLO|nr:unnamed protein product [Ostreobium quekettii]|eukprot:evm.model.scf_7.25 EVM.evm.TU.scf_7.25   scf_7:198517-204094(-)
MAGPMATSSPWLPACVCHGTAGRRRAAGGIRRWGGLREGAQRRAVATDGPLEWQEASQGGAPHVSLEDLPLPEGDTGGWPIIGRTREFVKDQHAFMAEHVKKHGLVSTAKLFGTTVAIIAGHDNLQKVMSKDAGLLNQYFMKDFQQLSGPSSFWHKDGDDHMALRRLIAPAFSRAAIRERIPDLARTAEYWCSKWANKRNILGSEELKHYTLDVTMGALLGMAFPLNGKSLEDMYNELQIYSKGVYTFGIDLPFTKFGKAMAARREIVKMVDEGIERFHSNPELTGGLRRLIDEQDEEGKGLTMQELEDNLVTIIYAGFDTTALALTTALMKMAQQPEVWKKMKQEQEDIIAKHGPKITEAAIEDMEYTTAVYQEGVRVLPSLPGLFRIANKTFEIGGCRIPKGWLVVPLLGTTAQHFDDRWPGEADYCPHRHLTKAGREPVPDLAFGLGPHSCVGRSLSLLAGKILLATMARGYSYTIANPYQPRVYAPLPWPQDGLAMIVER